MPALTPPCSKIIPISETSWMVGMRRKVSLIVITPHEDRQSGRTIVLGVKDRSELT